MSDPEKEMWTQAFFIPMGVPALEGNLPQRMAVVTVFSSNKDEPYSGRIRLYILYSAEQVGRMIEQNEGNYIIIDDFREKITSAVQRGMLPENDFDGLPQMEMSEPSVAIKMLSGMVFQLMTGAMQYMANAQSGATSWNPGGKAQA